MAVITIVHGEDNSKVLGKDVNEVLLVCFEFSCLGSLVFPHADAAHIGSNELISIIVSTSLRSRKIPISTGVTIRISNAIVINAISGCCINGSRSLGNRNWTLNSWSCFSLSSSDTGTTKICCNKSVSVIVSTSIWVGIIPLSTGIII